MEYNLCADALNKFLQLTPWVQVAICFAMCAVVLGVAYFVKEMVAVVMAPFRKITVPQAPVKEWRDSYYRSDDTIS